MARGGNRTREAGALLSHMILDHTITHFLTNFEAVRRQGVPPEVLIWVREDDEFSCTTMAKRLQDALRPLLGEVKVTVEPDPWIPRTRRPSDPPEAKKA